MAKAKEKSWERQPKESVQAYEAFYLYLQMGDSRSIRKVAQQLGKSDALMSRWSSTWSWVSRSRDYDNDLRRKELEAKQKAFEKMQERQIQTAVLLQKKAVQALEKLDYLTPQDIARFLTLGTKLEKETRRESIPSTENGNAQTTSLADTIITAYKRRMGGDEE